MIHGFHCTFGPLQAVLSTVDLASRRLAQQTERFSDSVSVPPLCLKWDKTVIFTQTDRLFTQAVLNYSFYSGVLLAERLRCPAVHYCPDSDRHKEI